MTRSQLSHFSGAPVCEHARLCPGVAENQQLPSLSPESVWARHWVFRSSLSGGLGAAGWAKAQPSDSAEAGDGLVFCGDWGSGGPSARRPRVSVDWEGPRF